MTTTLDALPWNLITKNIRGGDSLHAKIRQKIWKLETHLKHFPTGSVHLQIALERHPRKPLFTSRLTLRVPSNILHSEKSAPDVITAFDNTVKALLREIQSLKAALRREASWKRKPHREPLSVRTGARLAPPEPLPRPSELQKRQEFVRQLFQRDYNGLVRHAERYLRHEAATGEARAGLIDPREIVDEVSAQALRLAGRKPEPMSWSAWFYRLVHEELLRQRRSLKQPGIHVLSLEGVEFETEGPEGAERFQAEEPLDFKEQQTQPPATPVEELIADERTESPDEIVARTDLLQQLQSLVQKWPRLERDVFELYYVEGFEPDEVAMIVGQPLTKVTDTVTGLQRHLREEIRKQALL